MVSDEVKKESTNFNRVCNALDLCGNILRNELKLHIPLKDMKNVPLYHWEGPTKEKFEFMSTAEKHEYRKFDIPFLYNLLRNHCPDLDQPDDYKWPKKIKSFPEDDKTRVAHHLVRVKFLRDCMYHEGIFSLTDEEFSLYWHQLEIVCSSMDKRHVGAEYLEQLDKKKSECIDNEAEEKIKRMETERTMVVIIGMGGCVLGYFWNQPGPKNSKPYFEDCKNQDQKCLRLEEGQTTVPFYWIRPVAIDKEDGKIEVQDVSGHAPGTCFLTEGTHTIRFKAEDSQGQSTECTETIHVLKSPDFDEYCKGSGKEGTLQDYPLAEDSIHAKREGSERLLSESDKYDTKERKKEKQENETSCNPYDGGSQDLDQNDIHDEHGGDGGDDDQGGDNTDPGNDYNQDDGNEHDGADGNDHGWHGENNNQYRYQQGNTNSGDNRGSGIGYSGNSQNIQQNDINGERYQQYHANGNNRANEGQGIYGNGQNNGPDADFREGQDNSQNFRNGTQNEPYNTPNQGTRASNSTDPSTVTSVKIDTTKLFHRKNYEGETCDFCKFKIPKGTEKNGFADRYPFHVECMPRLIGG